MPEMSKNWKKYGTLVLITIQTSAMVLMLRYSRMQNSTDAYINSTAVFMSELVKLVFCIAIIIFNDRTAGLVNVLRNELLGKPREFAKMLIPALMYTVQNNLLFLALTNLDAATYQVTYQFKILTTAFFSVSVLGKHLTIRQWLALLVLMIGVIMVQWPNSVQDKSQDGDKRTTTTRLIGLLAVIFSSFSSGFAGVYMEKLIKCNSQNLWTRNLQLVIICLVSSMVAILAYDYDNVATKGFFHGYNGITWLVVILQALCGLSISLVMKYADNILKGFATTLSIIISLVFSYYILDDFAPTILFYLGTMSVLMSTIIYSL